MAEETFVPRRVLISDQYEEINRKKARKEEKKKQENDDAFVKLLFDELQKIDKKSFFNMKKEIDSELSSEFDLKSTFYINQSKNDKKIIDNTTLEKIKNQILKIEDIRNSKTFNNHEYKIEKFYFKVKIPKFKPLKEEFENNKKEINSLDNKIVQEINWSKTFSSKISIEELNTFIAQYETEAKERKIDKRVFMARTVLQVKKGMQAKAMDVMMVKKRFKLSYKWFLILFPMLLLGMVACILIPALI